MNLLNSYMLQLHVSDKIIDSALENLPSLVVSHREIRSSTVADYIMFRRLSSIVDIAVKAPSAKDDILKYISLLSVKERGLATEHDLRELSGLKRTIREEICTVIEGRGYVKLDLDSTIPALMLRICVWESTVKALFNLYSHIKRELSRMKLHEVLPIVWILSKYHLHSVATALLKYAVRTIPVNDPLDVLRLACLILFGILDLTERPFRMYTLKIHDALRYFSWILFIREPPLTKHQEFFLIFESSERPCLLSNAQYVSDQARLSLPPEVKIRRVQDHLFTVECEKFNVIIACTTDDSDLTLRVRCHEECILKSRDLDTKMHIDDQIIDVAPGETLIMIGQVDLL